MSQKPTQPDQALQDWLLDGGPPPPEADLFAAPDLPEGLAQRTLDACLAPAVREAPQDPPPANRPQPRGGWRWAIPLFAVAAGLLLWVQRPDPVGDPAQMVARGDATRLPLISLKMAARRDGKLERLRDGGSYRPGDTLFFRTQSDAPGWFALMVLDRQGLRLIQQGALSPGESDLRLGDELLSWTIEAGDGQTTFAALSAAEPIPEATLIQRLQEAGVSGQGVSSAQLCEAALKAALSCDAAQVEVAP